MISLRALHGWDVESVWGIRRSPASQVWNGAGVMGCPSWRAVCSVTSNPRWLKHLQMLSSSSSFAINLFFLLASLAWLLSLLVQSNNKASLLVLQSNLSFRWILKCLYLSVLTSTTMTLMGIDPVFSIRSQLLSILSYRHSDGGGDSIRTTQSSTPASCACYFQCVVYELCKKSAITLWEAGSAANLTFTSHTRAHLAAVWVLEPFVSELERRRSVAPCKTNVKF